MNDKNIIGLVEKVKILAEDKEIEILARIDTGATKSSIDLRLAEKLKLGPIVGTKIVKSAHGVSTRPLVEVNLIIENKKIKDQFSIADRSHMKYQVLIGQNVLKHGFLIDPSKEDNL